VITKNGPNAGSSNANVPQNAYAQQDIFRRRKYEIDIRKIAAKKITRSIRRVSAFIDGIVQVFGRGCKLNKRMC